MAKQLRVEVIIDKGQEAISLPKLSKILDEVQQFLTMLSRDVGIENADMPWTGRDFGGGSLSFTAQRTDSVRDDRATKFNQLLRAILDNRITNEIKQATLLQYAKIADPIESTETVDFGLYPEIIEPEPEPQQRLPYPARFEGAEAHVEAPVQWYSRTKMPVENSRS